MFLFLSSGMLHMSTPTEGTTSASTLGSTRPVFCRFINLRNRSDFPAPLTPASVGESSVSSVRTASQSPRCERLFGVGTHRGRQWVGSVGSAPEIPSRLHAHADVNLAFLCVVS